MENNKPTHFTEKTLKALNILSDTNRSRPMSASGFAILMWPDNTMHTKSSNQGNGACRGKAAWLCGGSYLAKLAKRDLVRFTFNPNGYYISKEGKEAIDC